MDTHLIEKLQVISSEEQFYLSNEQNQVQQELYAAEGLHQIDCGHLLEKGSLITVRPHSRFINFPEHSHNYIEMMYICKGSVTHIIDGKRIVMEKGDFLILDQHTKHEILRAEYDDVGINFIALPEFFEIPLHMLRERNSIAEFFFNMFRKRTTFSPYLLFQLKDNPFIENLMENLILSLLDGKAENDEINQYTMGLVFLYLLKHMDSLKQDSSMDYQEVILQATLQYINTGYKDAQLSTIAEDFHQSLSVLSKLIKEKTGFTFQELLMRKRFQRAVMLLEESDLTIEEIAESVGYENISYFYRQFKARYGMTPRKYRLEQS